MATLNNENEVERKKIINTGYLSDYTSWVIPLCLLDNTNIGADNYCSGILRMKRPNGLSGMDYKIDIRASKKYDQSNASYNLRIDGANIDIKIRPVRFLYSGLWYFGLHVYVPGANLGYVDFAGICHNWDQLEVIYTYNNQTQTKLNAEIYDSLQYLDNQGEQHIFHGNVIAPNLVNTADYNPSKILEKLKTVDGAGSGLDTDTVDGKHFSDIENQINAKIDDIQVGARNLVLDSWIHTAASDYGFACRTVNVEAGQSYVLSAAGNIDNQAIADGKTGRVFIYNANWSWQQHIEFTGTSKEKKFILFTAPATETLQIMSYLYPSEGSRLGKFYVEYYKVEIGNKMTDWLPAPEDTDVIITETDPVFIAWKNGTNLNAGNASEASGLSATALGYNSKAIGNGSVSLGNYTVSNNIGTIAIGGFSVEGSGLGAKATGEYSIAIGARSEVSNSGNIGIGYSVNSTGIKCVAIGFSSFAIGNSAVAIGNISVASGENSIAIGAAPPNTYDTCYARGNRTIIIGHATDLSGEDCIAIGSYNNSPAKGFVAIGKYNNTNNDYEIALGYNTKNVNTGTEATKTHFSIATPSETEGNSFEIRRNGDMYIPKGGGDFSLEKLQDIIAELKAQIQTLTQRITNLEG